MIVKCPFMYNMAKFIQAVGNEYHRHENIHHAFKLSVVHVKTTFLSQNVWKRSAYVELVNWVWLMFASTYTQIYLVKIIGIILSGWQKERKRFRIEIELTALERVRKKVSV